MSLFSAANRSLTTSFMSSLRAGGQQVRGLVLSRLKVHHLDIGKDRRVAYKYLPGNTRLSLVNTFNTGLSLVRTKQAHCGDDPRPQPLHPHGRRQDGLHAQVGCDPGKEILMKVINIADIVTFTTSPAWCMTTSALASPRATPRVSCSPTGSRTLRR